MSFDEKEDYYSPIEPNFYKFNINNILVQDVDYILKNNKINNVYLCCYSINNEGLYPFIQYYLTKEFNETLSFPSININNFTDIDTEKLVSFCQCYLFSLFVNEKIDKENDFKGFYYNNDKNLYLFIDFTKCNINLNNIHKNSYIWSVVATELYQNSFLDMNISKTVTELFMNNLQMLYLLDSNNELFELPDVWYCGREESSLNFTYTFGVSKNIDGLLGPYYYFTNYRNALIEGSWSKTKEEIKFGKKISDKNGKYYKGGIIRFAIFSGRCKIKLNKITDPIDNSETKKIKLNDETSAEIEKMTMRLTDYDGLWVDNYDSIFIGNVELDNGDKFQNGPLLAIKDYNQQIPLSYHYVNNKNLTDKHQYHSIL